MKYKNGIDIAEGDIILAQIGKNYENGVVLKIIKPNSEDADNWSLPRGGILFEGESFGLISIESFEDDKEDIEFVRRASREPIL
jgi:hypothetical protein